MSKWICSHCSAINPNGAFKCHNCPNTCGDEYFYTATTTSEPKQKFPPRVWINLYNEMGDLGLDFKGVAPMFPPDHKIGGLPHCDTEYLSLIEHEAKLDRERERIRGLAEEAFTLGQHFGERIGSIKQRISEREFCASDPNQHHTIRQMAREILVELSKGLAELEAEAEAAYHASAKEGEKDE